MFPNVRKNENFVENDASVVAIKNEQISSFVVGDSKKDFAATSHQPCASSASFYNKLNLPPKPQQSANAPRFAHRLRRTFSNVWSKIRHKKDDSLSSDVQQNANSNYTSFNVSNCLTNAPLVKPRATRVYRSKSHIRPVECSSHTGSTSSATNYEDVEEGSTSTAAPTTSESRRSSSCQQHQRCVHSLSPSSGGGAPPVHQVSALLTKRSSKSIGEELRALAQYGWYWGPISRRETQNRLASLPDGSFLVRDSCSDYHLLTLSYRCNGQTFHTRTAFVSGYYSLFPLTETRFDLFPSVVELIEHAIQVSKRDTLCYVNHGRDTMAVRLLTPVSRFDHVRTLQSTCRFVIRQNIRWDCIDRLPVPPALKTYLEQSHFS